MEKTIKYLENGEYHYATVKDVGDLAKLKTDSKDDLVTAINELFITGGEGSKKPDGYDELVDNVAGAIQKQQQMTDTITNMQQSAQLSDAEMQHMKQVQEELHQEYLKALKELNEAVDKAKTDAADLDKKTSDLQDKLDETFTNVNKEVSDVHKQLDSESAGLRKDLDDTKTSLESTRKDLLNNTQEFGVVNSEVKELKDKMDRRVWSTDLDPVREQVNKNTTEVSQTKDELKNKADQSSLDLVTNSVENLSTQIKENAEGLKVAVKRDELGGDVARLLNDKTNLLLGTRSFSGKDNWENRDTATIEPGYYKGLKSAAIQSTDSSIYQPYHIKANTAYTFSFFGKEDRDNPKATLIIKPIDAPNINIDNAEQPVHITTEWQRFAVTFSADQDCDISIQIIQGPEASNNILHLAGFKLQYGQNNTPWEPNEADVAENIEHNESQFNVYSDQIAGIVKKQEKMGDTERQLDTRITETAEGLKQTSKDLQDANGKITEFKGQLESTARGLKTEYEKYTNDAIGQISDSSLNLIRNSAFQNKDDNFAQWQNVSAKANIREDDNGLRWVELTQSGMTTDNPQGITSNYFVIKQGKVTVAVDIKLGDKANLDNQNILLLELYNDNKQRVDFTDVSVSQLGLSTAILNDHNVHRGLYRLGIDRKDVKYMTVKAILHRNGDLWFTNFSARLSSIDDGGYTPNPDDVNHQILKMNTKIEEDAEHIALKANSVDVTRDIKSAVDGIQVGGTNVLKNTDPDSFSTTESDHTWTVESAGNGHGTIVDLDSNFSARHGFGIIGNTTGNKDFNQYPMHWNGGKYVFTVYIRLAPETGQTSVTALIRAWNYTKGTESYKRMIAIKSREWQKFSMEIDSSSFYKDDCGFSFGVTGIGSLNFAEPMLVTGTKAMDWSPNPEDTSNEIKSAKDAAIQVASDQINLHVNELSTQFDDRLNKRVNEVKTASEKFTSDGIEQTVRKITDVKNQVDGIRVGARNLLHGTSDKYRTLTGDGYLCQTTATDFYTSTANYHAGDWFTYAATITNNSTKNVTLETWLFDGNKASLTNDSAAPYPVATHSEVVQPGQGDKRVSTSFRISGTTWYIRTYVIFDGGGAPANSKVQVKDERLVEGNMAGTWSPNPDDVDKKTDTQTLDSANIDQMKTQGHYFVHNLTGNPIGGWVYVDVIGNNNDRVRQDVYADQNNQHKYRSWNGSRWSDWEQGAYLSDVKTEVTASVENLGDRVTTEVNSITTRMSDQIANAVELIQKSDFSDGSKGSWTVQSIISATNPAPPAELGISGMKVIQSNVRDSYEDVWHSVTPGEKFNVDFWCAPSGMYDSSFGLVFYDANKNLVPNNQWLGVRTDHSGQWKHYTGEIIAPSNSAFAKPWFQIDMPADQYHTSWLAKPHIRRQDPRVTEAIKEVNTKWDVANGQIQGKVTATDVNNILNGKGYATQSWAQTMFTMKSDAITLQAVQANITDGIQNQVNDAKSQINSANGRINDTNNRLDNLKVGGRNLLKGTSDCWRSLTGSGWLGFTTALDMYTSVADYHSGDQFTYSATITNPSTVPVRLVLYCYGANKQGKIKTVLGPSVGPGAGAMAVSVTITMDSQTWFLRSNIESLDGKSPQTTVQVKNEQLEVGNMRTSWTPNPNDGGSGVNLLRGTADFSWPDGIGENGTVNKSYEKFDDMTVALHISGNNSGIYTKWGRAFPDGQIQVGEQYTFSFDIKGTGTFSMVKNESESVNIASGIPVTSDYQRVKVTGTVKALDQAFVIYFQGAYDVHIKNVKIERGTIATPWTPHPFDEKNKGINLLKSTAYWNPNDWNHISDNVWYDDNWTDNLGHKAYGHHTAWQGLGQTVYVTPGVYTWSAQIYLNGLDSNDYVYPYMGDSQYNGTAQVQDIRKPMLGVNDQNRWIDYSTTFYVKNAGNLCVRPELNRDHGNIHVGSQKLEHGMVATPWSPSPYDSDPKNIVSAINITPDQIKIASNKIEIDGNTKIHGVLDVKQVTLQGKNGNIDLSGDSGIKIGNNVGATLDLNSNGVDLAYKNEFKMDINSSHLALLQRNAATDQKEPVTIGIFKGGYMKGDDTRAFLINYNPGSATDTQLHGADFMALGYTDPNNIGSSQSQIQLISRNFTSKKGVNYRKGVKFYDDITLQPYQKINIGDNDKESDGKWTNDPLMIHRVNWKASSQTDRYQPTIRLGWDSKTLGTAGVTFLWDQLKPFGNRDISNLGDIWFNGMKFAFGYVHSNRMMGGADQPAFMRIDPGNGSIMSGIAFAAGSTWDLGSGTWNITGAMMNSRGA